MIWRLQFTLNIADGTAIIQTSVYVWNLQELNIE